MWQSWQATPACPAACQSAAARLPGPGRGGTTSRRTRASCSTCAARRTGRGPRARPRPRRRPGGRCGSGPARASPRRLRPRSWASLSAAPIELERLEDERHEEQAREGERERSSRAARACGARSALGDQMSVSSTARVDVRDERLHPRRIERVHHAADLRARPWRPDRARRPRRRRAGPPSSPAPPRRAPRRRARARRASRSEMSLATWRGLSSWLWHFMHVASGPTPTMSALARATSWLPWHATHWASPRLRKPCECGLCSKNCISSSWQRPHARATDEASGGVEAWAPWQPVHVGALGLPAREGLPVDALLPLVELVGADVVLAHPLACRRGSRCRAWRRSPGSPGSSGDDGGWMSCLPWQRRAVGRGGVARGGELAVQAEAEQGRLPDREARR